MSINHEITATKVECNDVICSNLTVGSSFNLMGLCLGVAYAPSTFATASANSYITLVSERSETSAARTETAFVLPNNAIIKDVIVTNNGSTIASSGTFQVSVTSSLNNTISGTSLLNDPATVAQLNQGGVWTPQIPNTSVLNLGAGNYVTVKNSATVTSGSFACYIYYFVASY